MLRRHAHGRRSPACHLAVALASVLRWQLGDRQIPDEIFSSSFPLHHRLHSGRCPCKDNWRKSPTRVEHSLGPLPKSEQVRVVSVWLSRDFAQKLSLSESYLCAFARPILCTLHSLTFSLFSACTSSLHTSAVDKQSTTSRKNNNTKALAAPQILYSRCQFLEGVEPVKSEFVLLASLRELLAVVIVTCCHRRFTFSHFPPFPKREAGSCELQAASACPPWQPLQFKGCLSHLLSRILTPPSKNLPFS